MMRIYVRAVTFALCMGACGDNVLLPPDITGVYPLRLFHLDDGAPVAVPGAIPLYGADSLRVLRGTFELVSPCRWSAEYNQQRVVDGVPVLPGTVLRGGSCDVTSRTDRKSVV